MSNFRINVDKRKASMLSENTSPFTSRKSRENVDPSKEQHRLTSKASEKENIKSRGIYRKPLEKHRRPNSPSPLSDINHSQSTLENSHDQSKKVDFHQKRRCLSSDSEKKNDATLPEWKRDDIQCLFGKSRFAIYEDNYTAINQKKPKKLTEENRGRPSAVGYSKKSKIPLPKKRTSSLTAFFGDKSQCTHLKQVTPKEKDTSILPLKKSGVKEKFLKWEASRRRIQSEIVSIKPTEISSSTECEEEICKTDFKNQETSPDHYTKLLKPSPGSWSKNLRIFSSTRKWSHTPETDASHNVDGTVDDDVEFKIKIIDPEEKKAAEETPFRERSMSFKSRLRALKKLMNTPEYLSKKEQATDDASKSEMPIKSKVSKAVSRCLEFVGESAMASTGTMKIPLTFPQGSKRKVLKFSEGDFESESDAVFEDEQPPRDAARKVKLAEIKKTKGDTSEMKKSSKVTHREPSNEKMNSTYTIESEQLELKSDVKLQVDQAAVKIPKISSQIPYEENEEVLRFSREALDLEEGALDDVFEEEAPSADSSPKTELTKSRRKVNWKPEIVTTPENKKTSKMSYRKTPVKIDKACAFDEESSELDEENGTSPAELPKSRRKISWHHDLGESIETKESLQSFYSKLPFKKIDLTYVTETEQSDFESDAVELTDEAAKIATEIKEMPSAILREGNEEILQFQRELFDVTEESCEVSEQESLSEDPSRGTKLTKSGRKIIRQSQDREIVENQKSSDISYHETSIEIDKACSFEKESPTFEVENDSSSMGVSNSKRKVSWHPDLEETPEMGEKPGMAYRKTPIKMRKNRSLEKEFSELENESSFTESPTSVLEENIETIDTSKITCGRKSLNESDMLDQELLEDEFDTVNLASDDTTTSTETTKTPSTTPYKCGRKILKFPKETFNFLFQDEFNETFEDELPNNHLLDAKEAESQKRISWYADVEEILKTNESSAKKKAADNKIPSGSAKLEGDLTLSSPERISSTTILKATSVVQEFNWNIFNNVDNAPLDKSPKLVHRRKLSIHWNLFDSVDLEEPPMTNYENNRAESNFSNPSEEPRMRHLRRTKLVNFFMSNVKRLIGEYVFNETSRQEKISCDDEERNNFNETMKEKDDEKKIEENSQGKIKEEIIVEDIITPDQHLTIHSTKSSMTSDIGAPIQKKNNYHAEDKSSSELIEGEKQFEEYDEERIRYTKQNIKEKENQREMFPDREKLLRNTNSSIHATERLLKMEKVAASESITPVQHPTTENAMFCDDVLLAEGRDHCVTEKRSCFNLDQKRQIPEENDAVETREIEQNIEREGNQERTFPNQEELQRNSGLSAYPAKELLDVKTKNVTVPIRFPTMHATGSVITPADVPPILLPPQKRSRKISRRDHKSIQILPDLDVTPIELAYNFKYTDEFMEFQAEKDSLCKRSKNFLETEEVVLQREIVVNFLIRIGSYYEYPSFIIYQAVRIFDAVLDIKRDVPVTELQLVSLASLWIALKRESSPVPTATEIISFAKDMYKGEVYKLARCEMDILKTLDFEISFPDAFSMLAYLVMRSVEDNYILADWEPIYYSSSYLLDVSLVDERLVKLSACFLATTATATALFLVMEPEEKLTTPHFSIRMPVVDCHVLRNFSEESINATGSMMMHCVKVSKTRRTNAVYKKYCQNRYGKVADFLLDKISKVPL